jgi:hypothetical protein
LPKLILVVKHQKYPQGWDFWSKICRPSHNLWGVSLIPIGMPDPRAHFVGGTSFGGFAVDSFGQDSP